MYSFNFELTHWLFQATFICKKSDGHPCLMVKNHLKVFNRPRKYLHRSVYIFETFICCQVCVKWLRKDKSSIFELVQLSTYRVDQNLLCGAE